MAQASGVTLALAAAAWLLLTRASSETEERVFAVSALLLVGGVADALSLSALFGGLVAGVFWRYAGRRPRETIQPGRAVRAAPPAGARAAGGRGSGRSLAGVARTRRGLPRRCASLGQLAGGTVATRVVGANAPRDLVLHLLPPGVFGVAFALNAVSVVGADASVLLAAVVVRHDRLRARRAVAVRPRSVGE